MELNSHLCILYSLLFYSWWLKKKDNWKTSKMLYTNPQTRTKQTLGNSVADECVPVKRLLLPFLPHSPSPAHHHSIPTLHPQSCVVDRWSLEPSAPIYTNNQILEAQLQTFLYDICQFFFLTPTFLDLSPIVGALSSNFSFKYSLFCEGIVGNKIQIS